MIDAVTQSVIRSFVGVRRERSATSNRAQSDVSYVIANTTAVGEAGHVTTEKSEVVLLVESGWRNRHVESQHFMRLAVRQESVVIGRSRNCSSGNASRKDRDQVLTWRSGNVDFENRLHQMRELHVQHERRCYCVVLRRQAAERILQLERNDYFVDQRIAEARYLFHLAVHAVALQSHYRSRGAA